MFKYTHLLYPLLRLLPKNASQSLDNPVQVERLPDYSAVEFDYPVYQDAPQAAARWTIIFLFLFALVAPVLVWGNSRFSLPIIQGGLKTIVLLLGAACLILGVLGPRWPLTAVAGAILSIPILAELVVDVPYALAAVFPAVVGEFILADRLATFYVHLKSAAPVPRERSLQSRALWKHRWWSLLRPLRGSELYFLNAAIFLAPVLLVMTHLAWTEPGSGVPVPLSSLPANSPVHDPFFFAAGMFFTLTICGLVWPFLLELIVAPWYGRVPAGPRRLFPAFWRALVEWTTYNRLNTHGVGVHYGPAGSCSVRRRLLIGVILLWACVWIGAQRPLNIVAAEPPRPTPASRFAQPEFESSQPGIPADDPRFRPLEARTDSEPGELSFSDGKGFKRPDRINPPLEPYEEALLQRLSPARRRAYLEERTRRAEASSQQSQVAQQQQKLTETSANLVIRLAHHFARIAIDVLVPTLGVLVSSLALVFGASARSLAGTEDLFGNRLRKRILSSENWDSLVNRVQNSGDDIERTSLFLGTNSRDDTPVLIPRDVFKEHAHILGDSGSGKTSLGLMPLIAQLMRSDDCSVVVIDLKADDQALFETLKIEAEKNAATFKRAYPFRWFTTEMDRSSYIFNPLTQRVMPRLADYQRTDIITAALGLQYGTDYGRKHFGDANYDLLNYAIEHYPEIDSFAALADVLQGAGRFPLGQEIRKAASNVLSSVRRHAACEPFNGSAHRKTAPDALEQAIDFADLFSQPQAVYFALPPSSGISSTAEIARIAVYSLLAAAQLHEGKRKPVFLIIDEFQRIVSNNLALFLQTARSMDVGVILSNQSLSDLDTVDADLIASVKTNTRFRQVFAAGNLEDIRDLRETSGETMVTHRSWDLLPNLIFEGLASKVNLRETRVPRLMLNDILLATDAFGRNIACLRRGAGYAQYGGMPFVMDSVHHIPKKTYEDRQRKAWPEKTDGMIVVGKPAPAAAKKGGGRILQDTFRDDRPGPADEVSDEPDEDVDVGTGSGIDDPVMMAYEQQQAEMAKRRQRKKKRREDSSADQPPPSID